MVEQIPGTIKKRSYIAASARFNRARGVEETERCYVRERKNIEVTACGVPLLVAVNNSGKKHKRHSYLSHFNSILDIFVRVIVAKLPLLLF